VNVPQDNLPAFLKTAERLKVKGLTEVKRNWERNTPSPKPINMFIIWYLITLKTTHPR
jgi:hypothetical protein